MHKLTWAFCLSLSMSMLFAPVLEASPAALIMASTLTIGDSAAVTPSDVRAGDVPDTPFMLSAYDAWPSLPLHHCSRHPRSHKSAKAFEPDGDGYASPAVSRLGHAVDYGGV